MAADGLKYAKDPLKVILVVLSLAFFQSCKTNEPEVDVCAPTRMNAGYVVGFYQCRANNEPWKSGFVITTLNPPDTFLTFNLPDTLYDFGQQYDGELYQNAVIDFLFPPPYRSKFPVTFSYEIIPEEQHTHAICVDNVLRGHFQVATGGVEVSIECIRKGH